MLQMAWFIDAWATLCKLGSLGVFCGKSSEEMWQLVIESSKHGTRLSFSSSAYREILRKGYTKMELFCCAHSAFCPCVMFYRS